MVNAAERRKNFETAIKGLHPKARALVEGLQPLHHGSDADHTILGIISSLEHADKHRRLITVGAASRISVALYLSEASRPLPTDCLGRRFAKDKTIISRDVPDNLITSDGTIIEPSEIHMEFTGTAKVLIKVTQGGGNQPDFNFPLQLTMLRAIEKVRGILRDMEPFIHR